MSYGTITPLTPFPPTIPIPNAEIMCIPSTHATLPPPSACPPVSPSVWGAGHFLVMYNHLLILALQVSKSPFVRDRGVLGLVRHSCQFELRLLWKSQGWNDRVSSAGDDDAGVGNVAIPPPAHLCRCLDDFSFASPLQSPLPSILLIHTSTLPCLCEIPQFFDMATILWSLVIGFTLYSNVVLQSQFTSRVSTVLRIHITNPRYIATDRLTTDRPNHTRTRTLSSAFRKACTRLCGAYRCC